MKKALHFSLQRFYTCWRLESHKKYPEHFCIHCIIATFSNLKSYFVSYPIKFLDTYTHIYRRRKNANFHPMSISRVNIQIQRSASCIVTLRQCVQYRNCVFIVNYYLDFVQKMVFQILYKVGGGGQNNAYRRTRISVWMHPVIRSVPADAWQSESSDAEVIPSSHSTV